MSAQLNRSIPRSLHFAYSCIDEGAIDLLSLDVFDTLVWRKIPEPAELFLILGRQLKKEGWLIPGVPAEAFLELRVLGERIARKKKEEATGNSREVTLKEIYWQMQGIFPRISIEEMVAGKKGIINESDVDELVGFEIDLERKLIEFDRNIVQLICYADQKNIPVVLVSDTFFELGQLQKLLSKPFPGLKEPVLSLVRKVYPSCDYGCSKREGLLGKMQAESGIDPSRILHVGDNPISDCLAAKAHGMQLLFYPKYDKAIKHILTQEWPEKRPKKRMQMLDAKQGDFGVTILRSRLRHEYPASLKGKDAFFWKYGASIVGPVLVSFILRVYQRCHEMGATRVFGLMREGRLYANIIRRLAPYLPHALEPIELWLSRRFISRAALTYASSQELFALTSAHASSRFTVESYCSYLGLEIEKIPKLKKWRCVDLEGEEFRLKVADFISSHPDLREQVLVKAAHQRKKFLTYLSNYVDFTQPGKLILVDGGWAGTIQGALHTIFCTQNIPITTHGLYLNTVHRADPGLIQGDVREGYLLQGGHPEGLSELIQKGTLEPIATACIGPLIDIDDRGQVILGKPRMSKRQQQETLQVHEGIYAYCDCLGKEIQEGRILWDAHSEELVEQMRRIFVRAASLPTKEEAKHLRGWSHDPISVVGTRLIPLGQTDYYKKFITDMIPTAAFLDMDMTWPAAYAAQVDDNLTRAAQAVHMESLPKECFLSQDTLTLNIFIDTGKGFARPEKQLKLRSNANRSFYAFERVASLNRGIRQIRLELPAEGRLRIKSLRLKAKRRGTPGTELFVFFEEEGVVPGLDFQSDGEGMGVTYAFDAPDIYQVTVNLSVEHFLR